MKKVYVIVADVNLFRDTRGELERIEGEDFSHLPQNTQFMSGKLQRHLCEKWGVSDERAHMLRVYPIEDFTTAVNDDDEILTVSFISYVSI
jgi:hypothetical protein